MRISSNQIFQQGLSAITDTQSTINRTQLEISSGKRILTSADDPVGAVRSVQIETAVEKSKQYVENGTYARTRLSTEEGVLSSAVSSLQRVHELTIEALNGSQTNETRAIIARELRQQLDNLLQLSNTATSDGNYLFSGYQEEVKPFTLSNGVLQYNGDDGQRQLQLGPSRTVADADPGSAVFTGIIRGNGEFTTTAATANTGTLISDAGAVIDYAAWNANQDTYTITFTAPDAYDITDSGGNPVASGSFTSGDTISFNGVSVTLKGEAAVGDQFQIAPSTRTDIFSVIDRLASSLEQTRTSGAERAAQTNELNSSLSDLSQAIDHLVQVQTNIGTRLNVIDQEEDINKGVELQLQETLSNIQDTDIVAAVAKFNQSLLSMQAAQQAFAKVQQLSLFNYL